MARERRLVVVGAAHHVVIRAAQGATLFSYPHEQLRFLDFLEQGLEASGCKLHVLTLLRKDVHMLLTPFSEDGLARCMQRCCQRYALSWNRSYGGVGKLFEQRFKSFPMKTDEQVGIVTAYIESRSVDLGLVSKALEYPWSTYPFHVSTPNRTMISERLWSPSPWYESLGKTLSERHERYEAFIQSSVARRYKIRHLERLDKNREETQGRINPRLHQSHCSIAV